MPSPQVTGSETTSSTSTAPSTTTTITTATDKQLTPVARRRRPQFRTPLGESVPRNYCHVRGALNARARARGQTPRASCTRTRPARTHRRVHAYAHALATAPRQLHYTAVEKSNLRVILCLEPLIIK